MLKPPLPISLICSTALVALMVLHAVSAPHPTQAQNRPGPAFPLKVAKSGRHLVDQSGTPFLIAGESPQALIANLSEKDAELFYANRVSHGFNTVWINLLCRKGTGGRADGSTYDGLVPFKTADDFATHNEEYLPAATG
jgi:hypothetical protein